MLFLSNRIQFLLPVLMAMVFLLPGCAGTEEAVIDGKWQVLSALGDGREMSTPGDKFDFQPEGVAVVRINGIEETGGWSVDKEKSTLLVKDQNGEENRYDYRFNGDSLFLRTVVAVRHHIEFVCLRMK